jgi:Domain of unknown function (DUF4382)
MKKFLSISFLTALLALTIGCGTKSASTSGGGGSQTASVFVTGEDAPVPSVVAFNITINSIALNNSAGSVTVLSTPTAVDFGRLVGLRSLLSYNTLPAGTYTSATFTFEGSSPAPSINYLDFTTTPPSLGTQAGTLSSSTVTVSFPAGAPLVVGSNGLAGLHMDFDLRQSLAVDSSGQITGVINPTVDVMAVSASDDLGQITDFLGSVISVNTAGNSSFTMQGPYGFQRVIDVNSQTVFNSTFTLASLPANAIVTLIGTMQLDGSILASSVEVITTDLSFISGRILAVNPTTGPVQTVTMFVGEELPNLSPTVPVDSVYTVDLSALGNSQYDICLFDNWFTGQLFNSSSLVVGQRIFVGGTFTGGVFTPSMVSLRRQGMVGSLVSGSVNITGATGSNQGNFQMQNDALMSYSAGGPFTVYTGDLTRFVNINGLAGLQAAGTTNLISRGLVFKDPTTSKPVVVAGRVRVLP